MDGSEAFKEGTFWFVLERVVYDHIYLTLCVFSPATLTYCTIWEKDLNIGQLYVEIWAKRGAIILIVFISTRSMFKWVESNEEPSTHWCQAGRRPKNFKCLPQEMSGTRKKVCGY